jgi:hypothetical protein
MASNALPRPPADAALPDYELPATPYNPPPPGIAPPLVAQQEETTHRNKMSWKIKCFFVVFFVAFFGLGGWMAATVINAGPPPTCGCPPGYSQRGICTANTHPCGVGHSASSAGYWECRFSCPNEQNQHGGDCWIGPDLNNEQRKHEEYRKSHCTKSGT